MKIRTLFPYLALLIAFLIGFNLGTLELPSWSLKKDKPTTATSDLTETHTTETRSIDGGIGFSVPLPANPTFENTTPMNTVQMDWVLLEDTRVEKAANARFAKQNVFVVNQTDPVVLSNLNLTAENLPHGGGIKSVFALGQREFAYVVFVRDGCATGAIIDLETFKEEIRFPCLPSLDLIDLNSTGGAVLPLETDQVLLTTGTPTSAKEGDLIRNLAQDPTSPWGKVLRLSFEETGDLSYEIYASGIRNSQGILKIEDAIYAVEHGPRGGDEINRIRPNANYGWPKQSFGAHYHLDAIGKAAPDQSTLPLYSFVPSIAPSYINTCPTLMVESYAPYRCLAISSFVGGSIYFVILTSDDRVVVSERLRFDHRIRKFNFDGNTLVAVTDFEGVILGELSPY
ncbi:MAG: PQQ-dependent sugar dehydrogenase [Pseudomonadota bacterium]